MTTVFHAPDIECDGCANSIKRALGKVPGVRSVDVDVDAKAVTVALDDPEGSVDSVREALDRAGFPATRTG